MSESRGEAGFLGWFGAVWGVLGVVAMLVYAVCRLSLVAAEAFQFSLTAWQWLLLIANTAFMAHAEGFKGFQRSFSPRVVARAAHLRTSPRLVRVVLAPLFCMGYFAASRRRLISTYGLTLLIAVFITVLQYLSQPWRGLLDAGVVVGLTWGIISIVLLTGRAVRAGSAGAGAELG
ncbi:MAG: hypothetical protein GKR94_25595 [Gammaproteobacteria bacterium]|nr:hypothetical protein [Gammaproteobacteria bacterium]